MQKGLWLFLFSMLAAAGLVSESSAELELSRSVSTLGSSPEYDTLAVTVSLFAQGQYDTLMDTTKTIDTIFRPADVIFVMDNSGSMKTSGRLATARAAAKNFIDRLKEKDRVAAMVYGTWTELDTIAKFTDKESFDTVKSAIDAKLDGSGNGTASWYAALQGTKFAMDQHDSGHLPVVILLSDGQDNCSAKDCFKTAGAGPQMGATPAEAQDSLVRYLTALTDDFRVFTVSLGSETNQEQMLEVADSGNGAWFTAGDSSSLDSIYNLIQSMIVDASMDTVITLTPIPVLPDTVVNPIDALLLIDNSGSMEDQMPIAISAAMDFIAQLKPTDRVSILSFGSWTEVGTITSFIDPTDTAAIRDSIATGLRSDGSATAVWYSIKAAIDYITANGRPGAAPVIVALTDGADNCSGKGCMGSSKGGPSMGPTSSAAQDTLVEILKNLNMELPVYTIALGTNTNAAELEEVATVSGANAYTAVTADELSGIYTDIAKQVIMNVGAREIRLTETIIDDKYLVPGSVTGMTVADLNQTVVQPDTITVSKNASSTIITATAATMPVWSTMGITYLLAVPKGVTVDAADSTFYGTSVKYQNDDFTPGTLIAGSNTIPLRSVRTAGIAESRRAPVLHRRGNMLNFKAASAGSLTLFTTNGQIIARTSVTPGSWVGIALPSASTVVHYRFQSVDGRSVYGRLLAAFNGR